MRKKRIKIRGTGYENIKSKNGKIDCSKLNHKHRKKMSKIWFSQIQILIKQR